MADATVLHEHALTRITRAGMLTAIIDGLFSSVLTVVFYGSTVARLFQGVASTLFGQGMLTGGAPAALVGVLMHFAVAFTWSAVFVLLIMRVRWIQHVLASRFGMVKVASAYGPFIWTVMSLGVIPLLTARTPPITIRWWVQFFGHIPFVGLPIVAGSLGRTPVATGSRDYRPS